MKFNVILILFFAVLTHGCAQIQPQITSSDETWEARLDRVAALTQWRMQARLSLTTPEQSQILNVDWQENPNTYQIRISSNLGQTGAIIEGDTIGVVVTTSEGQWRGRRLEDFVHHQHHLSLPFSNLRYWILGIPAPAPLEIIQVDHHDRLETLVQSGWTITYRDYDAQTGLPRRIRLEQDQWRINWVVQQWNLPTPIEAALK